MKTVSITARFKQITILFFLAIMLLTTANLYATDTASTGSMIIGDDTLPLGVLIVDHYGSDDAVYSIDIIIAPPGASTEGDEPSHYIMLGAYFPTDNISSGTVTFDGSYDTIAYTINEYSFFLYEGEYYDIDQASFDIVADGDFYTFQGELGSAGLNIEFSFEGSIDEHFTYDYDYDDYDYDYDDYDYDDYDDSSEALYGTGNLTINTETLKLDKVLLNYYGDYGNSYNIDLILQNDALDYYDSGYYEVYLEMFFTENYLIPGTYEFSDSWDYDPNTFSDASSVEYGDSYYIADGGTITIHYENDTYTVEGSIVSEGQSIEFSFSWSE